MTATQNTAFSDRMAKVKARIAAACARSGRSPEEITLVAVSKTWPLADLESATAAGATDLGENYVQEAVDKIDHPLAGASSSLALYWPAAEQQNPPGR